MKKGWQDYGREWLDTLVVAISVAMAFRAYFFEPFNIPTGSMQTTLWGYHTIQDKVEKAGVGGGEGVGVGGGEGGGVGGKTAWDVFPLSVLKWAWTGEKRVELVAPRSGMVSVRPRRDGFADVAVGTSGVVGKLPTDACAAIHGKVVRVGEKIWSGTQVTGDFIFVNRWWWNFFKPAVGDVMIFSTTGIEQLPQGTHYIKRMKATPGQTYELEHPVAGRPASVTMGPDEYFACGDNFNNSFDSRYWGPVPGKQLRGIGSVVFWPFNGWRKIR